MAVAGCDAHVHLCVHVHTDVHTFAQIREWECACVCTRTHACLHARASVRVFCRGLVQCLPSPSSVPCAQKRPSSCGPACSCAPGPAPLPGRTSTALRGRPHPCWAALPRARAQTWVAGRRRACLLRKWRAGQQRTRGGCLGGAPMQLHVTSPPAAARYPRTGAGAAGGGMHACAGSRGREDVGCYRHGSVYQRAWPWCLA